MVRSIIAAFVSLLFPGFGHVFVKFKLLKGLLISFGYVIFGIVVVSMGQFASAALLILTFHILAAVSAYQA